MRQASLFFSSFSKVTDWGLWVGWMVQIVMEHLTTKQGVDFVMSSGPNIAGPSFCAWTPESAWIATHGSFNAMPSLNVVSNVVSNVNPRSFALVSRFKEKSVVLSAGTITAHHLLYNRNALFVGGLRPHMFCLPILKVRSRPTSFNKDRVSRSFALCFF
jgi:dihydroorotase